MALHFQSLVDLYEDSKTALRRFPLTMIIALAGTVCAFTMSTQANFNFTDITMNRLAHMIFTLLGLFPLSITLALLRERYTWNTKQSIIGYCALALLGIALYFAIPANFDQSKEWEMVRMMIMIAISFLSVFYMPFMGTEETNGFWQLSRRIIIRIFFTIIFSGVLYAGLALTLASINFLFKLDIISGETFLRTWIFCAGIIAPWFFLSSIPSSPSALQNEKEYGELLKKFVKFILLPLLAIYTLVLYIYGVKIVITQHWPSGDTVYLIAGYAISGFLTYAIAQPLIAENATARKTAKAWLIVLLPVLILYFTAINLRVGQYGITTGRYFVVLLGAFYTIADLYLLISKTKNIILLPLIFSILAVVGNFGPISAYSLSKWSQLNRLESLAITEGVLINGKFVSIKISNKKENENTQEIRNILYYITNKLDEGIIEKWLPEDLKTQLTLKDKYARTDTISEYMFGTSGSPTIPYLSYRYVGVAKNPADFMNVQGYDYVVNVDSFEKSFVINGKTYLAIMTGNELRVADHAQPIIILDLYEALKKIASRLPYDNTDIEQKDLTFTGTQNGFTYTFFIHVAGVHLDTKTIDNASGTLLLRIAK